MSSIETQKMASLNVSWNGRDEIIRAIYGELRRLAEVYLRNERPNHTLQPTALVHEAFIRLTTQSNLNWENREQLVGVAATMMRRVLVNYAVNRACVKRNGGLRLSLAEADRFWDSSKVDLISLDEALHKLALSYAQEARVVELKFFGGLSISEIARVLSVSDSTVKRHWRFARAWLIRELEGG